MNKIGMLIRIHFCDSASRDTHSSKQKSHNKYLIKYFGNIKLV